MPMTHASWAVTRRPARVACALLGSNRIDRRVVHRRVALAERVLVALVCTIEAVLHASDLPVLGSERPGPPPPRDWRHRSRTGFRGPGAYVKQAMRAGRIEHRGYIERRGDDMPEIRGWTRRSR